MVIFGLRIVDLVVMLLSVLQYCQYIEGLFLRVCHLFTYSHIHLTK